MVIDVPTLVALVVSFVALFVSLIQMTQQLFSTASNFQRCSPESMGGWASRTHRRFRWRELRFRVMFSTPSISIDIRSDEPYILLPPGSPPRVPQRQAQGGEPERPTIYRVTMLGKAPVEFKVPSQNPTPWFLQTEMVVPYAKCSWFALLQDTVTLPDVDIAITEKQNSYDYLPEGVTRPIASADRKSFLTLMSLFGIQWKNKGRNGQFSGAGEFCELTVATYPYLGDVFFYHDVHRQRFLDPSYDPCSIREYELRSEQARLAMFHRFDLGDFAFFRTHNETELEESLHRFGVHGGDDHLHLANDTVNRVVSFYKNSGEWCPGLSEAITCWAYESMPRVVYKSTNRFKSRFSAVSARSLTTGSPMFVAMLLGGNGHPYESRADEINSVGNVTNWSREYLESIETRVKDEVKRCLGLAVNLERYKNIIVDLQITTEQSRECLNGVRELDTLLESHLERFEEFERRTIKRTMVNKQITYGSSFSTDAGNAAKEKGTWWTDEFDIVGANNYIKIVDDLRGIRLNQPRSIDEILARKIVINRMMRGSLWVMHNGNAPDQQSRVLECSLSSSWLEEGNPTVYIS